MIPVFDFTTEEGRKGVEGILRALSLDPVEYAIGGKNAHALHDVQEILAAVAKGGDAAVVASSQKFDDPEFTVEQIRVSEKEMAEAHRRLPAEQLVAIRRSIEQVREYQTHVMPKDPPVLRRPGVELGMRFLPLDSAGLYFPGGKASYPSSLIMLAVPAQVAGVKKIAVCTPPSKYGRTDLVLAACYELQLTEVFRAGGAAAIGALAFGTKTIPRVDKIVGPGNMYVQLAKKMLAGSVGIDGFLGPSEILVIADETARPSFVAADLLAQAEHDPGSSFLLTTSRLVADAVVEQIKRQLSGLSRRAAAEKAINEQSAIILDPSMENLIGLANRFAAEHVNLQTRDDRAVLAKLTSAGAVFLGPYSPVAAGDYVAGPSHCLPTNTTARFTSGVSVYEFLKRSSVAHYEPNGLRADASAIITLAEAEHLDGHAQSVRVRDATGERSSS
jgi:histidinol dehydrogenase